MTLETILERLEFLEKGYSTNKKLLALAIALVVTTIWLNRNTLWKANRR